MVDMHLAANAVLAGVIDHHVLNDLDAALMRFVDQVLIGRIRRFQPGVNPGPVVGVVTVVIETAAVFHRRGDPDRGKAEVANIIEPLDQPLEIAAPVRVFRLAGRAVELDAVAAEEVVAGIAIVKAGGEQKINGFLAEIAQRPGRIERRMRVGGPNWVGWGRTMRGGGAGFSRRLAVMPLAVGVKTAGLTPLGLSLVFLIKLLVQFKNENYQTKVC